MTRKSLLVLANSIKRNERCIAGRELLLVNGQTELSSWLRPVSNHDEGELCVFERVISVTYVEVGVGDIVEVSLDHQQFDPTQPENWVLSGNGHWADVGAVFIAPTLDVLEEQPQSLWWDSQAANDRVRDAWLIQSPPRQSLYVVRATGLVVRLSRDPHGRLLHRCRFDFRSQLYDLSLTDPVANHRLLSQAPPVGAPPIDVALGNVRICVSLARSYKGFHYKVVATILEGL